MNHITLIGRLTKDPELKYSQSGKAFCRFSLAVGDSVRVPRVRDALGHVRMDRMRCGASLWQRLG